MVWLTVRILTGISNLLSMRRRDKWGEEYFGKDLYGAWKEEIERACCHGLNNDEVPAFVRHAIICKRLREQGYDTARLEALPYHHGINKTIDCLAGYLPEATRADRAGLPEWAYYKGIENSLTSRLGKKEAKKVRERAQVVGEMDGVAWWSLDEILSHCPADMRTATTNGSQRR